MKNNLKACGIVVEYNPFHNGHIHHINESRKASKCDVLIAVMSPNFVQRGEPAFVNKYDRIQAALDHGVDLIIELPSYYALQSADYFAHAAIRLLKLMAVDSVVYGVEDLDFTHATFNEESFKQGNSYAKAHDSKSSLPNNILASCYEKELLNTDIKPIRIQRTNSYTSLDSSEAISSASAIRFADKNGMPTQHTSPMTFTNTHDLSDYEALIKYALISHTAEELEDYLLVDEGIQNFFKKNIHLSLEEVIQKATSKRYTRSRIQRTLMNILLQNRKDTKPSLEQARVLGMNAVGQKYLKSLKSDTPVYTTNLQGYINKDFEIKASQIFTLPYSTDYQNEILKKELRNIIIKEAPTDS